MRDEKRFEGITLADFTEAIKQEAFDRIGDGHWRVRVAHILGEDFEWPRQREGRQKKVDGKRLARADKLVAARM